MTGIRSMVLALSALIAVPVTAAGQSEGTKSTLDGVYTAEQADAGQKVYDGVCVECHAEDEYTGEMMIGWNGAPLFDLYDVVATTMPDDNPGSLGRDAYVSVLAYILELNGMPPGDAALTADASALRRIYFRLKDEP